ncbi:MAG TPA: DUF2779 domain-containing protein [Spirochaetota bacterium]|nr:DUF2779 domain-containing protein [Spirochaetota bacterium]
MKETNIKHTLSKSTFLKGLQCHKALWLNRYQPNLRDDVTADQQAVFDRGHDVGKLARDLFPDGADSSPVNKDYTGAIIRTAELIENGEKVIYEAAFLHNGVLCLGDILVKGWGGWKLYEVKSSTGLKDVYLPDAAVQYYIMTGCGIKLTDVSIVYLNNQYVRQGDLDLNQLFIVESVLAQVESMQDEITEQVDGFKKILSLKQVPDIDIGPHCSDPYDCDFTGHCWEHVPSPSVFDINRLTTEKKFELYRSGVVKLEDIPEDYPLNNRQQIQVDAQVSGKKHIDKQEIGRFLELLTYPHYYMDFETFMPAVPLFDYARPYQQVPFQFCVYYHDSKGAEPELREFLAEAGSDPRETFIQALIEATPVPGPIVVYNKAFEATRMAELARDFPKYEAELSDRQERLVDLLEPFAKGYYYDPSMGGSASIKVVLPALVPELSYNGLPISDGGMAMQAYEHLWVETDTEKKNEIRAQLLEYCKMDTYGMVRIVEELGRL